jgi:hypothetical protein
MVRIAVPRPRRRRLLRRRLVTANVAAAVANLFGSAVGVGVDHDVAASGG